MRRIVAIVLLTAASACHDANPPLLAHHESEITYPDNATLWLKPVLQKVGQDMFSVMYLATSDNSQGTGVNQTFTVTDTNNNVVYQTSVGGWITNTTGAQDGTVNCCDPRYTAWSLCVTGEGCTSSPCNTTAWDGNESGAGGNDYFPWNVLVVPTGTLQPNTTYHYSLVVDGINWGSNNTGPGSASSPLTGTVKTARAVGDNGSFRFSFYADPQERTPGQGFYGYGGAPGWGGGDSFREQVVGTMASYSHPDFVIIGGDLTIDGGGYKLTNHFFYDQAPIGPNGTNDVVWAHVPLYPAYGNHDWMVTQILDHPDCNEGNGLPALLPRTFTYVPTAAMVYNQFGSPPSHTFFDGDYGNTGQSSGTYYSFNWGNSHFVILSTGPDDDDLPLGSVGIDSNQYSWLKSDLAAAASDTQIQHIFVAMHDGPFHVRGDASYAVDHAIGSYPGNQDWSKSNALSIWHLVHLFETYHVQAVFYGHVHDYQHLKRHGVHYFNVGTGGGTIDQTDGQENVSNADPVQITYGYGNPGFAPYGYEKMMFGYVDVDVNGEEVNIYTRDVIDGGQLAATVQCNPPGVGCWPPPPLDPQPGAQWVGPVGTPATIETTAIEITAPTNLTAAVWGSPNTDTYDVHFQTNTHRSGATYQLWTSTSGYPYTPNNWVNAGAAYSGPVGTGPQAIDVTYPALAGQPVAFRVTLSAPNVQTSDPSNYAWVEPPSCVMPSSGLTATEVSGAVVLNWSSIGGCSGLTFNNYIIERLNSSLLWDEIGYTPAAPGNPGAYLTFTDSGFDCGNALTTGVTYRVRAKWTGPTWSVSAPTPSTTVAFTPQSCTPKNIVVVQASNVYNTYQLFWSNQQSYNNLRVGRTTDPTLANITWLTTLPAGTTTYSDSPPIVSGGTTYYYVVAGLAADQWRQSSPAAVTTFAGTAPGQVTAQQGTNGGVYLSWSYYGPNGAPGVVPTSTTILRSTDGRNFTRIVDIPNQALTNGWHDVPSESNFVPANTMLYYQVVARLDTAIRNPNGSASNYVPTWSAPSATVGAEPPQSSACRLRQPDTIFSPGMAACGGNVTWPNAATLCAPGYQPCTAAQWAANMGTTSPHENYWLADNLGYSGSGSNACAATTTNEGNCGTNTPMRVCGAAQDVYGNRCNWTGCGLNAQSPNEWLGGCVGNTTAGTMCCMSDPTTACAGSVAATQVFAPGVVGCAGKVNWTQRATLCAAGCQPCTAAQYVKYSNGVVPRYDFWTDDLLNYGGTGSNACAAYDNGSGTGCGTTTLPDGSTTSDPMRVCLPGSGTDPLGNSCNWHDCGLDNTTDKYFGGCAGNATAGTLCCCNL